MKKTLEFLKSLNISSNDYIIVGCSSGPDSMCLLNLLYENDYKVICAHVNHNIRKESKDEYDYLKNFCNERKIIFEGLELKKDIKENEYYYRKKRYSFYKKLADKYQTKYIATAHHADDLMETILMRISRGSNLKGYVGFSKVFNEKGYLMIKPLIFYTKDEILDYLTNKKIKYFIDSTNDSDNYTRNRYRHNIIPFLKKEYPFIHKKYLQFSNELEKANRFINGVVENEMKKNFVENFIDLNKFSFLEDYIKECELERIFSQLYGDDIDLLSKKVVNNVLMQLKTNRNFTIYLPKGYEIKREYEKLIIEKRQLSKEYRTVLKDYNIIDNKHIIEKTNDTLDNSNYLIKLNSLDIALPLYIRSRKDGDKMQVKNMQGQQKIKQIFIDKKIPPNERKRYPIVVDANDTILWVPGIKKSKFDNDNGKKYDIILKYIRKEWLYERCNK